MKKEGAGGSSVFSVPKLNEKPKRREDALGRRSYYFKRGRTRKNGAGVWKEVVGKRLKKKPPRLKGLVQKGGVLRAFTQELLVYSVLT